MIRKFVVYGVMKKIAITTVIFMYDADNASTLSYIYV